MFLPVRNNKIALMIVTGKTRYILFVMFKTLAMQIAPNATWESPSPINEKRLSTSVTPSREEQSEINTPTIKAYLTNAKLKYCAKVSIIFLYVSKKSLFSVFTNVEYMARVFERGICVVRNHYYCDA